MIGPRPFFFPFKRDQLRSHEGFTLVEILVVLAIIAVLIGILLPALARAKHSQRNTACLSNLHQIATAFTLYAQDNDGFGPDDYADVTWDVLIWPYLEVEKIYLCPADEDGYDEDFGTSYEWRDTFQVAVDHPERALSGKDLISARPASLVLVFDAVVGWHAPDSINVAMLDASATSMNVQDYLENMELVPE